MRQTGIGNAAFKAIWKSILKTLVCTGSYFASAWEQCPETEKGEWALGQEGPRGSRARRESGTHTCVKRSQVPHRLGSQLGEVNVCVRVECPSSLWLKPKPKPPLFVQWSVCAGKEAPFKSTVATLKTVLTIPDGENLSLFPQVLKSWAMAVEVLEYCKSTVGFILWSVPPDDTRLKQSISGQGKETQLSPAAGKRVCYGETVDDKTHTGSSQASCSRIDNSYFSLFLNYDHTLLNSLNN